MAITAGLRLDGGRKLPPSLAYFTALEGPTTGYKSLFNMILNSYRPLKGTVCAGRVAGLAYGPAKGSLYIDRRGDTACPSVRLLSHDGAWSGSHVVCILQPTLLKN